MSGRSRAARALHGGFTLLELLVAMFIAAVIFAMGYGAINQAVKNRIGLQEQQAKLLELQTAVRVIEQDLVQVAPRPIRQPVGSDFYPALMATAVGSGVTSASSVSSAAGQPVFSLTRAGWDNPNGAQRPGLQRVAYYFDKGTLRREYWTVLDPTQTSATVRRDLMTHLKSVSLRFYSAAGWETQWPRNPALDRNTRPIAVEVTLETEDWGKIIRLIELPG
jgi:general secretion pathway protein J